MEEQTGWRSRHGCHAAGPLLLPHATTDPAGCVWECQQHLSLFTEPSELLLL